MAKDKEYDWRKANWWDYPEDDDVEVKEIEIDISDLMLPSEYAKGGVANLFKSRKNLQVGGPAGGASAGGNYGGNRNPDQTYGGSIFSGGDGNKLVETTDYPGKVNEKLKEKFSTPPVDKTNEFFSNLMKYQTLKKNDGLGIDFFSNEGPKKITKELFTNALSNLSLEYPDIPLTNEDGFLNTENVKTVVDNAILDGKISPIDGLTLTQSIGTEGNPSGIGVNYNNDLFNFNTGDIDSGTYGLGTNYNLGDLNLKTDFNVVDDNLASKKLAFDYGDGTLTGSQKTYPGSDFQINEAALNKDFNINDNFKVGIDGKVKNLKSDGSTLFTDQSLTPSLTFNKNIGDGKLSANISKEIMEGGDTANLGLGYNNNGFYARGDNLLDEDRTGTIGYQKNIGDFTDKGDFGLTFGAEKNLFDDEWTAGAGLKYKFNKGGRVGFVNGGGADDLTGEALSIYNSMNAYGASDAEIQAKLQGLALWSPDGTPIEDEQVTGIINEQFNQGGGGGGGGITNAYNPNQNLGTTNITDYEAEAYGIGPTWGGSWAKLQDAFSRIPTPLNLARMGINKFQNWQTDWQEKRAAKKEQELQAEIDAANQAALASIVEGNIAKYGNQNRPNTGINAPGGEKGQSPTGGDVEGTPFNIGGLATMFTRRR